MRVPFVDLTRQYQQLKPEIDEAISLCLAPMTLKLGPNVSAFEQEWASYCGTDYCIGVGSGTDALTIGLKALGLGRGDKVITSSNTFFGTWAGIMHAGCMPVGVDIVPETGLMDLDLAEIAIHSNPNVKAIMPVHLYGHTMDMPKVHEIAMRHGLFVIEDAAQAHGIATLGAYSNLACFSFYMAKNLGGYGESGAIITNDENIAMRVREYRDSGRGEYDFTQIGYNSRMDEIQAAVLRVKLKYLNLYIDARREIVKRYIDTIGQVYTPVLPETLSVWHLFVIRATLRDQLREKLSDVGVATGLHYRHMPSQSQELHRWFPDDGGFTKSDRLCNQTLSLPLFPEMTDEEVDYVIQQVTS